MNQELRFYPAHPSGEQTRLIETTPMPRKEQDAPYAAKALADTFRADLNAALAEYQGTRFEVTGVAIKVGPDIHSKPSIELSDSMDGSCQVLCVFPNEAHYSQVSAGDTVVVRGNYLVMSNQFGVVLKFSELVDVKKGK